MIKILNDSEKKEYFDQLVELWTSSYSDDKEYVSFMLKNMPADVEVQAYVEKQSIKSAVYLFNVKCENNKAAIYMYAGAVRPADRGLGIWKQMMLKTVEYGESRQAEVYCVATDSLIEKYIEYGLSSKYSRIQMAISNDTVKETGLSEVIKNDITEAEIRNINIKRNKRLEKYNIPFIKYSDEFLLFLQKEKTYCGNVFDKLIIDKNEFYLIGDIKRSTRNTLIIDETDIAPIQVLKLSGLICEIYEVDSIVISYPECLIKNNDNSNILFGYETGLVYSGQGTKESVALWSPFTLL